MEERNDKGDRVEGVQFNSAFLKRGTQVVNKEAIRKAEELMEKYEYNWGKKIEINYFPPSMTQEKFVVVLERIVETGESLLVGYEKCFLDKVEE